MSFTEESLENAIIELLGDQGYPHVAGPSLVREPQDVLIPADLHEYLLRRYRSDGLTASEVDGVVRAMQALPAADLYDSNRAVMKWVSDGYALKREDHTDKDLHLALIDVDEPGNNVFKLVNQLEIVGQELRIPDAILYINGLPLVVFEFKSATRPEATLYSAYQQLTVRYRRDIPALLKYNALCVISDGVNSKVGSLFANYEFYYAWRKITGDEAVAEEGISSLHSMIGGLFDPARLLRVIRDFVFFPDASRKDVKIVPRYPQFYAAIKLYENVLAHRRPEGDGKGGTYFGATGCGKSYTMLFLSRLLMRSVEMASPTLILITDRTDLDSQLSEMFVMAKSYIGDDGIVSVESRAELREKLQGRKSGGVFLTTIHKFTEDTQLLTERTNVVCISDEAHRSQTNLDQKVSVTELGVKRSFGFAKYLHDSLPNATYVGFTGTPVDATLDVFGPVVDAYTMTESVKDDITVRIVYEGRAAKVVLDNTKLKEIEQYYTDAVDEGASEYQVEESKRITTRMDAILGDPERLSALAADFVEHYETRVAEGATQKGKAMFVCNRREVAWAFYQELIALRPAWAEVRESDEGAELTDTERKQLTPVAKVMMVMTRGKDDDPALYELLGTKEDRKKLDAQFKNAKSNFKIAIVVDMWLTGFDVPFLDTIYIDKPLQKHSLIQTISRVNRKFEGKDKGLVVDYIGIKRQMNLALAQYSKGDKENIEDIEQSVVAVKDHLDLLKSVFYTFDATPYFAGDPLAQLACLKAAAEFVQQSEKLEKRFMELVKRLKAAYDICSGSNALTDDERNRIHFYLAVRSIVFKLTRGDAPDTEQMNARVRDMISDALKSDGVEEIFRLGDEDASEIDLFDDDYLNKINKIKLPNTRIKLLQQLLAKAIADFKKVNKTRGVDFSKRFAALVDKYNERDEDNVLVSTVLDDIADQMAGIVVDMRGEASSHENLGIDVAEKSFYDILVKLAAKYDFQYPEDKVLKLAKAVKQLVDDKASYTDWHSRDDIKAELKVDLILLLGKHGYPPVDRDEVYKEIFEQAENYKKYRQG
jgi:type I restriction enzyme R subunit